MLNYKGDNISKNDNTIGIIVLNSEEITKAEIIQEITKPDNESSTTPCTLQHGFLTLS